MAKRWLQSIDLEIDEQGRPVFETALSALAALIAGDEGLAVRDGGVRSALQAIVAGIGVAAGTGATRSVAQSGAADYSVQATVINVADTSVFAVGDIVQAAGSGELMLVYGIGTEEGIPCIRVTRGYLNTTAETMVADQVLNIMRPSLPLKAMASALESLADASGADVSTTAVATANAGVASAELLAASLTRRVAIITNMSDSLIYVAAGVAAEIGKGIPLAAMPNAVTPGGSCTFTGQQALLAVNGISSGANKAVAIYTAST